MQVKQTAASANNLDKWYYCYLFALLSLAMVLTAQAHEQGSEPGKDSKQMTEALVLVHQVQGEEIESYYSFELKSLRQDRGGKSIVLHFDQSAAAILDKSRPRQPEFVSLRSLAKQESDPLVQQASLGLPEAVENDSIHWRFIHEDERSDVNLQCRIVVLQNRWGESTSSCVRPLDSASQLSFYTEHYARLPTSLLDYFEGSDEIYLYRRGLVPVEFVRFGKRYTLVRSERRQVPKAMFALTPQANKS